VGAYLETGRPEIAPIDPRSKRAFYRYWYQSSVVSPFCPAREEGPVEPALLGPHGSGPAPEQIEAIQQDVLARLGELFELGEGTLL